MSHEIRTPMNAIIGLDSLALRNAALLPETREYLEKIGGSARHLLGLINDILDMSRIESGRMMLRREDAKTVPIIAMTANAFDEDMQRSLRVGMNAHLSKPVEPEHLFQTLEELIWESEHREE